MTDYIPQAAWVVYTNDSGDYYMEKHKTVQTQKGTILGAGAPLTVEDIKGLIDEYATFAASDVKGLLPKNCIHWFQAGTAITMAWIRPASPMNLLFSEGSTVPSGKAHLPALLFICRQRQLFVYALAGDEAEEDTQLYYPPFFNIMDGQKVCLGSAHFKNENYSSPKKIQSTMESLFFMSEFSYIHAGGKVAEGVNMNLLWKELIETGKPFPAEALKPLNKTVIEVI